eukprot:GDKK01005913.1.p1 GENE.GDKK01005913.1~~GDKK01005913.1.p1  ORF type:complete len:282 (+),score=25.34 GDKK01005913.1:117-848(+)
MDALTVHSLLSICVISSEKKGLHQTHESKRIHVQNKILDNLFVPKTIFGRSKLRRFLTQPLSDLSTIQARQDCVTVLVERKDFREELNHVLVSVSRSLHGLGKVLLTLRGGNRDAQHRKILSISAYFQNLSSSLPPIIEFLQNNLNSQTKKKLPELLHTAFDVALSASNFLQKSCESMCLIQPNLTLNLPSSEPSRPHFDLKLIPMSRFGMLGVYREVISRGQDKKYDGLFFVGFRMNTFSFV